MLKVDCDWNRDLDGFDNCCIWAYKTCTPEGCKDISPRLTKPVSIQEVVKCVECEEEEDRLP